MAVLRRGDFPNGHDKEAENLRGADLSNLPSLAGRTILQLIPDLDTGGAERTVLDVTEAIVSAGGRALVASKGGRLVPELEARGGELVSLDMSSKNPVVMFRNANQIAALVAAEGVGLIHARSRAPAWSGWRAAQATGTPFVTTYHGAYSGISGPKRVYNSVMAKGDLVIANSRWIGDHIKAVHGIGDDRIVIIPRGVDLDVFDPAKVPASRVSALREAWGLGAGDKRLILLLPARLTSWKGQALALDALARLDAEERTRLVLVLAGDAQGRRAFQEALETQIAQSGLGGSVLIAGHCSDMPAAFAASDIVVAPSLRPEAFGRTAIEAAAMAKPVIAADHGGARETVIDGETGALFPPGDAGSLAAALRSLVQIGPSARAGMGRAGQENVRRHYSKRGLQTATLSVYTALMTQGISRTA